MKWEMPFIPAEIRARRYFKEGLKEDCWPWTGFIGPYGYGIIEKRYARNRHKKEHAHRIVFQIYKGPIPNKLMVRHTCDNRACVNPHHLILGTAQDNKNDSIERGRHAFGERSGMTKLTNADIKNIRSDQRSQDAIAKVHAVGQSTISRIKRREVWGHIK
jgi:hypothetical protein